MPQPFTERQKQPAQNSKKPDFEAYVNARRAAQNVLNGFTFANPATKQPDRLDNCLSAFYQLYQDTTASSRVDVTKYARDSLLNTAALVPFFENVPVEEAAKGLFDALGCTKRAGAMHAQNLAKDLLKALQPQQAHGRG